MLESWPRGAAREGLLSALRVLDFSTFLPGPYCTQMFGDLGADVIKVEPPAGDPSRMYKGGMYDVGNRNKRGIAADLKDPGVQERLRDLAGAADVIVEGFRPGAAERLGVGYEQVCEINPGVVYCSISGFGQFGPWSSKPGHDLTYLAKSGALSFSPHWKGAPRRSGVPIADLSASSFAAIAILAALRDKERTGRGCHLDVSLLDTTMAFIAPRGGPGLALRDSDRIGVYANNDVYEAADGIRVAISAVEQHFWERLKKVLSNYAPELNDPKFATPDLRIENGDLLYDLLAHAISQESGDFWEAQFELQDVPGEKVLDLCDAVRTEHAQVRGLVGGRPGMEQILFPVLRNGKIMGNYFTDPPALNEHEQDVFRTDSEGQ